MSMLKFLLSGICFLLIASVNVLSLHQKTSGLQIWSQRLTKLVVLPLVLSAALPMDTLLGVQGNQTISAFDHAEAAQTIPWEIFTRIGPRVTRIPV